MQRGITAKDFGPEYRISYGGKEQRFAWSLEDSQFTSILSNILANTDNVYSKLNTNNAVTELSLLQNTAIKDKIITEGQVSGSGTSSSYDPLSMTTTLTVGTEIGLRRLKTKISGTYISGKIALCSFSFNFLGPGQENVIKRAGYYTPDSGILLELENGELSWVIRSNTGEIRASRQDWSGNKFDADDGIGYNFDFTKCHIAWVAFDWRGCGYAYCGFFNDDKAIVSHKFSFSNITASPYMPTANCFLSFEIERTLAGGISESFLPISATLRKTSLNDRRGIESIIRQTTTRIINTANTFKLLYTFRLNPAFVNTRALVEYFNFAISSNVDTFYEFLLVINPTFNAAYVPNWQNSPGSAIQYQANFDNTLTVTGWSYIVRSVLSTTQKGDFSRGEAISVDSSLGFLSSNYAYEPEIWALIVQATEPSVSINYSNVKFWEQL